MNILKKTIRFLVILYAKLGVYMRRPKAIGVVGSVGKTTVKDLVAHLLSKKYIVKKTENSCNELFDVALTALGVKSQTNRTKKEWIMVLFRAFFFPFRKDYPEYIVLEIGVDGQGDIRKIGKFLTLDILILTALPKNPVHSLFFTSPEALYLEKMTSTTYLRKDGDIIYNIDDENIKRLLTREGMSFGKNGEDLSVSGYKTDYKDSIPQGMSFTVDDNKQKQEITLKGVIGAHVCLTILPALLVAKLAKIPIEDSVENLKGFNFPAHRSSLKQIKGFTVIDDSYNSSPLALRAAIDSVSEITIKGKKIALLGDMLELGDISKESHREALSHANKVFDVVLTVGDEMKSISEKNNYKLMEVVPVLKNIFNQKDVLLVKGSRGIQLDKALDSLVSTFRV